MAVLACGVLAVSGLATNGARIAAASARFGGPFQLVDQDGHAVTDADLRGRPLVLYFGYTDCPDVCPTALAEMSEWQRQLGNEAGRARFVFVTVDPARDTPAVLRRYLASFGGRFTGLTGPPAAVARVLREYRVAAKREPGSGNAYAVDHTASIFLVRSDGSLAGTIAPQDDASAGLAALRRLLGQAGT